MTTQAISASWKAGATNPRLPSLTSLRFFAALLVIVSHIHYVNLFADGVLQADYNFTTADMGAFGVSFFFVLSGFVLTWSARVADTTTGFWRRRLVKIVPNHVAVFAVAFALLLISGFPIMLPQVVANLFLVQPWIPDVSFMNYQVNGVTWSLAAEILFYASFPLLIGPIRRIRSSRLWAAVAVAAALSLAMPFISIALMPGDGPTFDVEGLAFAQQWFVAYFPVARIPEFILGMLLARIVLEGRRLPLGIRGAVALVVASYVVTLFLPPIFAYAALYPLPLGMLLAAVAASDVAGRRTFLHSRPMMWLGNISYALFMVNVVVLFYVVSAVAGDWTGASFFEQQPLSTPWALLFIVGLVLVTIVVAAALHSAVEAPTMRRWGGSNRTPRGTGAVRA